MFITFEGIEGSGKTTLIQSAAAFYKQQGALVTLTREPGGTPIGRQIRSVLLNPQHHGMDAGTELLLYFADRVQHIREVIETAIASRHIVLCDRYFDATVVYQGMVRGMDARVIQTLFDLFVSPYTPDKTFLFDLPAELGLKRATGALAAGERSLQESRFENETIAFHDRVRKGYLNLADREPGRFCVIDASRSLAQVEQDLLSRLPIEHKELRRQIS